MGLEEQLPNGILLANVEKLVNWTRKTSMWPATFGLACCAIEMMTVGGSRYDIARFGMERFSATPRQADLMIVAGRVTNKMAPVLRQIYDQMPEPRWVLSMGVCASTGGMFNNYAVVQGVDHVVPVDMYLPGCPPRPEMLLDAILKLHAKVMDEPINAKRAELRAERGDRTEMIPSSERYAPKNRAEVKRAERQQLAQRREMGAERPLNTRELDNAEGESNTSELGAGR
ncbi:NuoB/complex I 20 kDa subunit family protein [Parasphingorhabdus pacifica]